MSDTSPQTQPNILGKFASIVTLLGAALYFTGWIYRWAYFSFFQLEVTTLDLPFESFLMVPFYTANIISDVRDRTFTNKSN